MKTKEPILCYISEPWAYFTHRELHEVTGDDWGDSPYEHNAGIPYGDYTKVAYDAADLYTPRDGTHNSNYSVDAINAGCVPWLSYSTWALHKVVIPAGATLSEFRAAIKQTGGNVYEVAK